MENLSVSVEMQKFLLQLNEKMKDINDELICQFNIDGEGAFTLDMSAAGGKVTAGAPEAPEVEVDMSLKTLEKLLSGKLHPMIAYSSRKIKLRGDMQKAMKLAGVLG